jgi:hypothetical protein
LCATAAFTLCCFFSRRYDVRTATGHGRYRREHRIDAPTSPPSATGGGLTLEVTGAPAQRSPSRSHKSARPVDRRVRKHFARGIGASNKPPGRNQRAPQMPHPIRQRTTQLATSMRRPLGMGRSTRCRVPTRALQAMAQPPSRRLRAIHAGSTHTLRHTRLIQR